MQIGVVFPQTEFGDDPAALRDYAQTVEGLGFTHVLAYDHVLGANPDRPEGFKGPYTHASAFHEPFLLFSYMAALTQRLSFITGILILPQRQTALVAKQAAELDVLSSGRFRLGIGIGWNPVEYTALGENFHNRGKRIEEQVQVLRRLWTDPLVQFNGKWHNIPDAGLNPLPVQRPIPVWFGGYVDTVLKRVALLGDGWLPGHRYAEQAAPDWEKLLEYMDLAGRPHKAMGLEPRLHYGDGNSDTWSKTMEGWRNLGATHLSVNTMGIGLDGAAAHLDALKRFALETGL